MPKILIICGPTATGKTKFGIELAKVFDGELVSADSRQVFVGKNLIHGKDLPPDAKPWTSNLEWRGHHLNFYNISGIRTWLYDVVQPHESFSVALWKECADIVISDIHLRRKLPIVVGGSGLYLKTVTHKLDQIVTPPSPALRARLSKKTPAELLDYLGRIDPLKVVSLNHSDRQNPYRLIRAIEIAQSDHSLPHHPKIEHDLLQIGLTTSRDNLYSRVDDRVDARLEAGAAAEDRLLASSSARWKVYEHQLVRRQLTWFKKQPSIHWFDISNEDWSMQAKHLVKSWYNQASDQQHAQKN